MRVLLPAFCLLTGSCAQRQPAWFEIPLEERDRSAAESFRSEMAAWEVKHEPVPDFREVKFTSLKSGQELLQTQGLKLELRLGPLRESLPNGWWRTDSKYRLMDRSGRLLVSARSIQDDAPSEQRYPEVIVHHLPGSLTFLIAEFRSGAPWRCVLIRPASFDRENGLPIAWKVQYPVLSVREIPSDSPMAFSPLPLLGATDTHLYLRADGRTYAVPLDSLLKEEPPDFPLG